MKKLDFSKEVAKRVTMPDNTEWIQIPDHVAKAIYENHLPIEIYRVYWDNTEGLLDCLDDVLDKRCDFFGIESESTLTKYVDIQIKSEEEITREIIEHGKKVYTQMALQIATIAYTYKGFLVELPQYTSNFSITSESYVEFVIDGVKMEVGKCTDDGIFLSNTFYLECEDGEWTEMGYSLFEGEFVWMDEVVKN